MLGALDVTAKSILDGNRLENIVHSDCIGHWRAGLQSGGMLRTRWTAVKLSFGIGPVVPSGGGSGRFGERRIASSASDGQAIGVAEFQFVQFIDDGHVVERVDLDAAGGGRGDG